MTLKKIGRLLLMALPVVSTACGDDDDDSIDYNYDDPRIRSVIFSDNTSAKFVVNDVESKIFNYDSLSYGFDAKKIKLYFYGYTSSPTIQYKNEGDEDWHAFANGSTIDLTSPITVLSTSEDGKHQKTYAFDLRIHKYDVEAFTWKRFSTIALQGKVVSRKAFVLNDEFFWFCKTETESLCFSTSNGEQWEKRTLDEKPLDFSSMVLFADSLWCCNSDGELFASSASTSGGFQFEKIATNLKIDELLTAVDDKLFAVSGDSLYYKQKDDADFVSKDALPEGFSVENATSFMAASGVTQVGYVYSTQNESGMIWVLDYKGNLHQLVEAGANVPYLQNPMVYIYNNTLGIVGGEKKDGSFSDKCYASYNSGVSWSEDWHKNLTDELKGIGNAGVFVLSKNGELLIVGG